MAKNKAPTDILLYTYDFGANWTECKFSQDQYQIADIVAEPNNTALDFLVLATKPDPFTSKRVGVLIHVDFSNIHMKQCEEQDYEYWSAGEKTCSLGQKISYQRRKEGVLCYNPKSFEAKNISGICKCAMDDYECDYCYERYIDGKRCVPICGDENIARPPDDCSDFYYVSIGYRLVDEDKCEGGLDLKPRKTPCPKTSHNTSPDPPPKGGLSTEAVALIVIFTIAGVFLLVGGCVVLSVTNQRFREVMVSGVGRLPSTIRDPFKGTSFIRLDNVDDDDLSLGISEEESSSGGLKELAEDDLANTLRSFKDEL